MCFSLLSYYDYNQWKIKSDQRMKTSIKKKKRRYSAPLRIYGKIRSKMKRRERERERERKRTINKKQQ